MTLQHWKTDTGYNSMQQSNLFLSFKFSSNTFKWHQYEMQFKSYLNDLFVNKTEPWLFSLKSPDCLGRLSLIKSPGIIMIEVLYESRMTFVECSMKAGWLLLSALRKQDGFRWVLYESRMAFVECPTKAGWLSLSALRKQDGFRLELYESLSTIPSFATK